MTSLIPSTPQTDPIHYPTGDGQPVAETYDHLYALLITLEVLRQYLSGQQATVLADQFLYYAQGLPKLRVAPDVMVIFGVAPGGRDNYKLWEEGQVPAVIFEITSPSTQDQDQKSKYALYEQLGVQEYWLFDPKGQWIPEQLRGYQLRNNQYQPIQNNQSQVLQLQLQPEDKLIGFYRLSTGEKLLIPQELKEGLDRSNQELKQERQRVEQELQRAEQERQRADREAQRAAEMEAMLERYREQFGDLS